MRESGSIERLLGSWLMVDIGIALGLAIAPFYLYRSFDYGCSSRGWFWCLFGPKWPWQIESKWWRHGQLVGSKVSMALFEVVPIMSRGSITKRLCWSIWGLQYLIGWLVDGLEWCSLQKGYILPTSAFKVKDQIHINQCITEGTVFFALVLLQGSEIRLVVNRFNLAARDDWGLTVLLIRWS